MMQKIVFIFLLSMFINFPVYAQDLTFDFKDPKGVNSMSIRLDSMLEPIMGMAQGISGTLVFDPQKPKISAGQFAVAADQIVMANPTMTRALASEDWLNAAKYPSIEFKLKKVSLLEKKSQNLYQTVFEGDFILNGISRPLSVPVFLTHLPGKLKERNRQGDGDLLILRTQFDISRKDFNIKPDYGPDVVGPVIQIHVSIVGASVKK